MLIVNYIFFQWLRSHPPSWHYARKGNVMLSVYIIAALASILFGFSLRSIKAGVLGLLIVLISCDAAVYSATQGQYVGPVLVVSAMDKAIDFITTEIAVADKKADRYNQCVKDLNNKVWNPNQTIPSHRWIHDYCSQQ